MICSKRTFATSPTLFYIAVLTSKAWFNRRSTNFQREWATKFSTTLISYHLYSLRTSLGHELGVMTLIFAASNSWGLKSWNRKTEKNRLNRCTLGVPQSETVRFQNKTFITLNCYNYWFSDERSLIVYVIKNWDPKNSNHDKKILSWMSIPHYGHLKKSWFWRFFLHLLWNLGTFYRIFCLIS